MCHVVSGEKLKNKEDIQNLVIGILFRQEEPYVCEDILKMVSHYCKGTKMNINDVYLEELIKDNLDFLVRNRRVKCLKGKYTPNNIFSYI